MVRPAARRARTRPLEAAGATPTLRHEGQGSFTPAPLTTEGDSLPSLARGGGEWWGASRPS
ncbi:hypothetical protein XFF6166_220003 [Xanthomonas citri pv. fuscans]|nr:hypothetical protein XFF6166_220003 [Xanthomonas citri pv. fuscans]SOO14752.1 hypothetical protein XFF7766_360025 [Xanthomonas citri pv. fuscans]SOO42548.1 hypothetical protein XFF1815_210025 [Xanthomonas citri pv. fuscans]